MVSTTACPFGRQGAGVYKVRIGLIRADTQVRPYGPLKSVRIAFGRVTRFFEVSLASMEASATCGFDVDQCLIILALFNQKNIE